MTLRACSFDVYDTVLTRVVGRPSDLLLAAARRLLAERGLAPEDEAVQELFELRVAAERAARRAHPAEDLDLAAIYACFSGDNPFGVTAERAMACELEMERASVRPVAEAASLVREMRRAGAKILFISDMYLPADFIRGLLEKHGLALPGDGVYVSSQAGLTKHSGNLFRLVLKQEGLRPGELLHVGDNPRTDVDSARALGIQVRAFAGAQLTPDENQLLAAGRDQGTEALLAASSLAGSCRAARTALPNRDPEERVIRALAADVVAPLLVGFTAHVLRDAARRKIPGLSFVSRDGQILLAVADILATGMEAPARRYLYGSRQAWFLPSLHDPGCEESCPDWLFVTGHSRTPASLLRKLGLDAAEAADLGRAHGFSPDDLRRPLDPKREALFRRMLAAPDACALVRAKAAKARELLLAYFQQEGVLDRGALALVDVGWTGKTQQALRRVLGDRVAISGFYLALSAGRQPLAAIGPYRAWFVERTLGADRDALDRVLFRNANLIEQAFTMADHGQVMGYARQGNRIEPVLAAVLPDPRRERFRALVRETVLEAAENFVRLGGAPEHPVLKAAAAGTLAGFLRRPRRDAAALAGSMSIGDDQTESRARVLARPLGLRDLLRAWRVAQGAAPLPGEYEASFDWIEGCAALSPAWLRPLLRSPRIFEMLRTYRKSL